MKRKKARQLGHAPNGSDAHEHTFLCAYCAKPVGAPEVEHVFPQSWYPDHTPPSSMLTVPSHRICNGELGAVEERLLRSFALGLHPDNTAACGVQTRVFNSMNKYRGKGRNEAERAKNARVRENLWKKLKQSTRVVLADEANNAFPTPQSNDAYMLQNEAGLWVRGNGVVEFAPADLARVTAKFVRGVYYLRTKVPLPPHIPISTPVISEHPLETAYKIIKAAGWHPQGLFPSFIYWGGVATEDPQSSLWFFLLWNTYLLHGATGQLATEYAGAAIPASPPPPLL